MLRRVMCREVGRVMCAWCGKLVALLVFPGVWRGRRVGLRVLGNSLRVQYASLQGVMLQQLGEAVVVGHLMPLPFT